MNDVIELIKWSFGGFWRWIGFFFLITAIGGSTRGIITALLAPITSRAKAT